MMKLFLYTALFLLGSAFANLSAASAQNIARQAGAQTTPLPKAEKILGFEEYLGYVKQFHPLVKQAGLVLTEGQAEVLRARGGFDPKLVADYERKDFKDLEYYDLFDAKLKIPTWYGVELKAGFERNEGVFLNDQNFVPDDGLFAAGISVDIGQGFWINERMATLRKAKFFRQQTQADRDLLLNQVIYDASLAYFNWLQAYQDAITIEQFVANATLRYEGIQKNVEVGESAQIDATEALISLQDRQLSFEQAKVTLFNAGMRLSNFLWLTDDTPLELEENVIPNLNIVSEIDISLQIAGQSLETFTIANHPKLQSLNLKLEALQVDRSLKANKLLPKLKLEYNFLTETPDIGNSFLANQYKGGVNFSFPLFLRKERGDLKLSKLKIQNTELDLITTELMIQNDVKAIYQELESYTKQNTLIADIVTNYQVLLSGEERKFEVGESSIFLVNSRERSLIDSYLKQNKLQNSFLKTKAKLFKSIGVRPEL
ncbi:TolC family protein [Dokdonia ponticola]|uniref:TolC family protein n=1 Tax=Dokdonia ponticola TaxID=2041041 RepID=A0ABV9HYL6_9FLAO